MKFEQDFLMRQIQYLTQILQQIIFKKNQNQYQEAVKEIEHALEEINRDHPEKFSELSLHQTEKIFVENGKYHSQLALAVADLLFEQGEIQRQKSYNTSVQAYQQALLLYKKSLQEKDAAVPLDIAEKIKSIKNKLTAEQRRQVNEVL